MGVGEWTQVGETPKPSVDGYGEKELGGLLSLACHFALEPPATLSLHDWVLIALLGLGPLGGAFFLWDAALKIGDPRRIGLLAFLTPLLSTALLMLSSHQPLNLGLAAASAMIVGAAFWGHRISAA